MSDRARLDSWAVAWLAAIGTLGGLGCSIDSNALGEGTASTMAATGATTSSSSTASPSSGSMAGSGDGASTSMAPGTSADTTASPPGDTSTSTAGSSSTGDAPLNLECFEAEDFSSQEIFGEHSWQLESSVAGYSGAGYVVTVPNQPTWFCEPPTTPDCGAILHYEFELVVEDDYSLYLYTSAPDDASDSLWWGYDGEFPTSLDLAQDGQWGWHPPSASAVRTLTAGSHVLDLWMRENGARVDKISITTAPGPP